MQLKFKDAGFGKNALIADLKIYFDSKTIVKPGSKFELTNNEIDILTFFNWTWKTLIKNKQIHSTNYITMSLS